MIKDYISNNKDRFLSELFELLKIQSVSADSKFKEEVDKAARGRTPVYGGASGCFTSTTPAGAKPSPAGSEASTCHSAVTSRTSDCREGG
mgnify:CR=1 FL=1